MTMHVRPLEKNGDVLSLREVLWAVIVDVVVIIAQQDPHPLDVRLPYISKNGNPTLKRSLT